MNYFELYPGDYLRDTAELTLAEHGAFLLLLSAYYATERAIPSDNPTLFRLVRAMTIDEQNAVTRVSELFFPISSVDGLRHNKRADEEIVKARARIDAARFNGGKGGRPKKPRNNPVGFIPLTQQEPSGVPSAKAPHTPYAIHHQEQKPPSSSSVAGQPARPPAGLTGDDDGPVPGEQDLPSWIPRPLWREFYRHRAVLRKPLSIPGQRQVVRRLVELSEAGHDIASSLRQTMAAGLVIPVTPKDPDHANSSHRSHESVVERIRRANAESEQREAEQLRIGHGG